MKIRKGTRINDENQNYYQLLTDDNKLLTRKKFDEATVYNKLNIAVVKDGSKYYILNEKAKKMGLNKFNEILLGFNKMGLSLVLLHDKDLRVAIINAQGQIKHEFNNLPRVGKNGVLMFKDSNKSNVRYLVDKDLNNVILADGREEYTKLMDKHFDCVKSVEELELIHEFNYAKRFKKDKANKLINLIAKNPKLINLITSDKLFKNYTNKKSELPNVIVEATKKYISESIKNKETFQDIENPASAKQIKQEHDNHKMLVRKMLKLKYQEVVCKAYDEAIVVNKNINIQKQEQAKDAHNKHIDMVVNNDIDKGIEF